MVATRAFPHLGGIQTHVHEVAPRLAASGFEVTVLTTDPSGALPGDEQVQGVRVLRLRAWPEAPDYSLAPGVVRAISRLNCDLVHLQGYQTLLAPLVMSVALGRRVPYLVSLHSGGHSSRLRNALRVPQWWTLRPLLSRAVALIAVSDFERRYFARRLGLALERFRVIPNGSDLPAVRASAALNGPLILSVGRLERYKGHHRVLAALPWVLQQVPDARLRILGSGPYEAQLRRLAHQLNLSDRVEIGRIVADDRREMAHALGQASLVTLLSDYEAGSIAILEAMALGKPVLVSNGSSLGDLREQGAHTISPVRPAREVGAAIISALRAPTVSSPMALPTWDECAKQVAAVYREARLCRAGA
jgi:glycosyltransferase involved in cell wall biosynthesis